MGIDVKRMLKKLLIMEKVGVVKFFFCLINRKYNLLKK